MRCDYVKCCHRKFPPASSPSFIFIPTKIMLLPLGGEVPRVDHHPRDLAPLESEEVPHEYHLARHQHALVPLGRIAANSGERRLKLRVARDHFMGHEPLEVPQGELRGGVAHCECDLDGDGRAIAARTQRGPFGVGLEVWVLHHRTVGTRVERAHPLTPPVEMPCLRVDELAVFGEAFADELQLLLAGDPPRPHRVEVLLEPQLRLRARPEAALVPPPAPKCSEHGSQRKSGRREGQARPIEPHPRGVQGRGGVRSGGGPGHPQKL
mmetsp:Transcript_16565/g.51849  ORF Transcript_16565/g.51849 Transcript_16565/m.51849 type:complete len:266 (-) Transcript_16565:16-813(-)